MGRLGGRRTFRRRTFRRDINAESAKPDVGAKEFEEEEEEFQRFPPMTAAMLQEMHSARKLDEISESDSALESLRPSSGRAGKNFGQDMGKPGLSWWS